MSEPVFSNNYSLTLVTVTETGPAIYSLEDAARLAVDAIRRVRPQGPYIVAGHCYWGVVAFEAARQDGFIGTDESSMVERLDVEVSVVPGSDRNIKITKSTDMELAHLFLREETRGARPLAGFAPAWAGTYIASPPAVR